MAKKIVSVFLAVLLLVIALFMVANLASDLLIRTVEALEYILGGNKLINYHVYNQGHVIHFYLDDNFLRQNLLNNQTYFQNWIVCFIATTISSWANFVKNASVALGFVSLAIIVISCAVPKNGGKIKAAAKVLLILAFLGIFAGNLVIGFVDTASWIRTVIWSIQGILSELYIGEIIALALSFLRYNLWKIDNYVYAVAALVGAVYVLTTMFSKKAKKEKADSEKAPKKVKVKKKQAVNVQASSDEYIDIDASFGGEVI